MKKTWIWLGIAFVLVAVPLACCADSEPTMTDCAEVAVSAAIGLAETYVEGLIQTMVVLAATAQVKGAYWDGMFGLLETFQEASLPMATWFVLPDGSYHTVNGGQASANLSDRAYFPIVMSGQIATGYLVVSRSTGRVSMVTAVPEVTVPRTSSPGSWYVSSCGIKNSIVISLSPTPISLMKDFRMKRRVFTDARSRVCLRDST